MFDVNTRELVRTAQPLDNCGSDLTKIGMRIRDVASNDCLKTRSFNQTIGTLYRLAQQVDRSSQSAHELAGAVRTISTSYANAERNVVMGDSSGGSNQQRSVPSKSADTNEGGSTNSSETNENDGLEDLLNWAKLVKEAEITDGSKQVAGDFASVLAYINSFKDFYDKDKWKDNGLEELLDLCKDSGGLWKRIYDGFVKHFDIKGVDGTQLFSLANQRTVAGFGVGMSLVGAVSTIVGLVTDSHDSLLEGTNAYVEGIGKSSVDIGKSVYDVKNLLELIRGGSKSVFAAKASNANTYSKLARGALAIVTQTARSFDKYVMADGDVSIDDMCYMANEVAVSGLYYGLFYGDIIEALSHKSGEDLSHMMMDEAAKFRRSLRSR